MIVPQYYGKLAVHSVHAGRLHADLHALAQSSAMCGSIAALNRNQCVCITFFFAVVNTYIYIYIYIYIYTPLF